jgi:N-acetylglucosamine kinase-like BadF-type ATPase
MHEGFAGGRDDMLAGLADMKSELSRQIQESAEEGKRYSRMLFEDALTRVATLIEHRKESPGRKPRAPRRKR